LLTDDVALSLTVSTTWPTSRSTNGLGSTPCASSAWSRSFATCTALRVADRLTNPFAPGDLSARSPTAQRRLPADVPRAGGIRRISRGLRI
jgi:hypothetical protein